MFCFGAGVKDSPSFKISISSWVSGTFDKFNIFVDCGCVIGGSCDSRSFLVITVNLTVFISWGVFQHILTSYQFYLNPVLRNAFLLIYRNVYVYLMKTVNFTVITKKNDYRNYRRLLNLSNVPLVLYHKGFQTIKKGTPSKLASVIEADKKCAIFYFS